MLNNVTGLTICYNTEGLLRQAIESIRTYYPDFNIIIIDGSPIGSDCFRYTKRLTSDHTAVLQTHFNIGHGNGMHVGLEMATTEYVLIFDTDIIMREPCIEKMLDRFTKAAYGVGMIIPAFKLSNWTAPMRYLHPFFKIVRREEYFNNQRFIHHGAPCHKTYAEMSLNGAKRKLLNFPVKKYVEHLKRGTRTLKPSDFHKGWVH